MEALDEVVLGHVGEVMAGDFWGGGVADDAD
jgi:hypothetical protein